MKSQTVLIRRSSRSKNVRRKNIGQLMFRHVVDSGRRDGAGDFAGVRSGYSFASATGASSGQSVEICAGGNRDVTPQRTGRSRMGITRDAFNMQAAIDRK